MNYDLADLDLLVVRWRKSPFLKYRMCAGELEDTLQRIRQTYQPKLILKCRNCGHIAGEGDSVGMVGCSRCNPTQYVNCRQVEVNHA